MDAMLPHMLVSNQGASRVAREFNIVAATDVTGFGLAGHMLEMLNPSNCSAKLNAANIPLYEGFEELTATGVRSTLYPPNRESAEAHGANIGSNDSAAAHALFDPQTSGGLLIAVSEADAGKLVEALHNAGCSRAAVIGQATPAKERSEIVLDSFDA